MTQPSPNEVTLSDDDIEEIISDLFASGMIGCIPTVRSERVAIARAVIKAYQERRAADEPTINPNAIFAIIYDDYDRRHDVVWTEAAARERFRQISGQWNAHLFVKVESNSRDDSHKDDNVFAPTAGAGDQLREPGDDVHPVGAPVTLPDAAGEA